MKCIEDILSEYLAIPAATHSFRDDACVFCLAPKKAVDDGDECSVATVLPEVLKEAMVDPKITLRVWVASDLAFKGRALGWSGPGWLSMYTARGSIDIQFSSVVSFEKWPEGLL